MKPLLVSNYDSGERGATYRLHQGLKSLGVDSQMLVQSKRNDNRIVFAPQTKLGKSTS